MLTVHVLSSYELNLFHLDETQHFGYFNLTCTAIWFMHGFFFVVVVAWWKRKMQNFPLFFQASKTKVAGCSFSIWLFVFVFFFNVRLIYNTTFHINHIQFLFIQRPLSFLNCLWVLNVFKPWRLKMCSYNALSSESTF